MNVSNEEKTQLFGKFKNKKTRMCNNLFNPLGCPYGSECHYAHSREELIVTECAYGDDCIFMCDYNNSNKVCYFIHPKENMDEYYTRVTTVPKEELIEDFKEPIKLNIKDKCVSCSENDVENIIKNGDSNNWNIDCKHVFMLVHKLMERGDKEINLKISY
jgi:hypothetical protein